MSEILEAIGNRRARRALSDQTIDRKTSEILLDAAHLAPSCSNNQPWRLIPVDDPATLAEVREHLTRGNYWARQAPLIVVVASRVDLDCRLPDGRTYALFDCGLSSMNLMTQATKMGLVAHPIAGFRQAPLKESLGIPSDYAVITLIVVGRPSDDLSGLSENHRAAEIGRRERKPLDQIVSWNRFSFDDPPSTVEGT